MKRILSFFKTSVLILITIIIVLTLVIGLSTTITFFIIKNNQKEFDETFQNKYEYVESYGYYKDDIVDINDSNERFEIVYDKLPEHLLNIIKNNWVILVSEKEPIKIETAILPAGCTYSKERVIWLMDGFNEETLCHEIGHALDISLGTKSESKGFYCFYGKYWNVYKEFNNVAIDKHSTSTSDEFFASLFTDYILHYDYLNEHCPDVVIYFDNLFKNDWSISGFGEYCHFLEGLSNRFHCLFGEFKFHKKIYYVINEVESNVKNNSLINVNDYSPTINYTWPASYSEEVIEIILDITKDPDKYDVKKYGSSEGYILDYDFPWDRSYYDEILSFTTIYFGDESFDPVDVYIINNKETKLVIKKDVILNAEKDRQLSLEKVEETLSTIHTGTETEILIQISDFIINKMDYKIIDNASSNDFWEGKSGDCVSYAMMFKQFCDRLGIPCDIIYVRNALDVGHVYNRVTLSDGTFRYYDLSNKIVDSKQLHDSGYHINSWKCS